MTSPGVEHTPAEPNAGHERQVSKDTQATLNDDGTNAAANEHRRSRKRAVSDDGDAVDDAHGAKRLRVTAETSAAPPAATTAESTGLPTAAAPQHVSNITTVAPAAVDPNHDATADEPDEVQDDDDEEEEVAEAAPAQGRCRCTTAANYDDDDVVPPTCVWTTLEPAAIAYGIIPNYVDDNQTPWRLTVIPLPRGARRTEQRVNPWLPSCQWVRLGPAHLPYERDPDWVDDDGGAWCLLLVPPPRRFAPSTAAGEDEASDDEWPEQVPFVAPQAGQEEECDCCCETSSSEPSDADEERLAEDDHESDGWFPEDDDESDDDEPMPPMPTVDQDAKDAEADLLMEKIKARVQNAIDDGEGSKWNNGHCLELVEGYLADDEMTDEEDVENADGVEEDDDGADGEDECVDEDECEEDDDLEYVDDDELEYVDDDELEYADFFL